MSKGLNIATNYYNRIEALSDWRKVAFEAIRLGYGDLTTKYHPDEKAGWRKIDKCTAALRKALGEAQKQNQEEAPKE